MSVWMTQMAKPAAVYAPEKFFADEFYFNQEKYLCK